MYNTGTDIKAALAKRNLTKLWLLNQLANTENKWEMSAPTLSAILSDSYSNKDKAAAVIIDAGKILDMYDSAFEKKEV